jgi:beta-glucosidase
MQRMDERGSVSALVASLSVEHKAALCLGSDFWHTAQIGSAGIESIMVSDGPHGLRKQPGRADHAGLSGSVPATCFPTASALGSSWDPELARAVGVAIGLEARAQDVAVVLGPGINIKRSPLCGRNFEYLSEDPHLSGRLAAAMVEGLQSQQVGASLKHFAANNQETDRVRISADVDERTLREIYLAAFEHVVTTARPWTVMCSYNKINGEYASQDRWLLTDLLRGEWGFDGVVVSDWGAVHDRVAALAAGLDLEMPPDLGVSDRAIINAVAAGSLDEALLDQAAARVLRLVQRSRRREPAAVDIGTQHALARRAAGDSMVLLKNAGGVLPLQDGPGLSVAVVGEFARTPRFQGAGSSQVSPTRVDIPLEELTAALPAAALRYAPGFSIGGNAADPELAAAAVSCAAGADVIIAFLGLPPADESEGFDRTHIDLPAAQTDLLAQLATAYPGTPIVVVLFNGSAVRTSTWDHAAAAVIECWLAGQATGSALADVLTGAVNPSGRLTETIPVRLQDTPSYLNFPGEQGHVRYGEGVFVGYRGFDAADLPVAYPFGHGLSYSNFHYSALNVSHTGSLDGGDLAVTVSCSVANAGERPGREVVQLYVGNPGASVARPPRELKRFHKLNLASGETRQVTFTLTARDLSYWSAARSEWTLEPGLFELAVGASSRDLRLTQAITVSGTPPRAQLTGMSTLEEWLGDPVGGPALRREIGTDPDGQPAGILGNDELIKIIGNFTLHTLAAFPGLGITHEVLGKLITPVNAIAPSGS